MREGSKITGTTNGAVFVTGVNASFKMEGGEIVGNRCQFTGSAGGVYVTDRATFEMRGGYIYDNSYQLLSNFGWNSEDVPSDIFIDHNATLTISGNAFVGNIILVAGNATSRSSVRIGENYNGEISSLHLRGEDILSLDRVRDWWTNAQVIVNGTGRDNTMFNNSLGFFRGSSRSSLFYYRIFINDTHVLNSSGVLVLK
jgi:hypothetical protein